MEVHVPAMRGKMGSRTYFSCMMPLNAVPQFFKFTDWSGMLPEDREQRVLVEKRIPELANYITENEEDYLFSSITASYKSEPVFVPYAGEDNIGTLKLQLGDELIINDGQHRCAGIVRALKNGSEDLKGHTLSVLLFPWESTDRPASARRRAAFASPSRCRAPGAAALALEGFRRIAAEAAPTRVAARRGWLGSCRESV